MLQVDIADVLMTVLGSKLFIPAPEDLGGAWKSPEQLRNKVLPSWLLP